MKANPKWKYMTQISRVRGPHFLCPGTMKGESVYVNEDS